MSGWWAVTVDAQGVALGGRLELPVAIGRRKGPVEASALAAEGAAAIGAPQCTPLVQTGEKYFSRLHVVVSVEAAASPADAGDVTPDEDGPGEGHNNGNAHNGSATCTSTGVPSPAIIVKQIGKNPTFWGPLARVVAAGSTARIRPADLPPEGFVDIFFPRELGARRLRVGYGGAGPALGAAVPAPYVAAGSQAVPPAHPPVLPPVSLAFPSPAAAEERAVAGGAPVPTPAEALQRRSSILDQIAADEVRRAATGPPAGTTGFVGGGPPVHSPPRSTTTTGAAVPAPQPSSLPIASGWGAEITTRAATATMAPPPPAPPAAPRADVVPQRHPTKIVGAEATQPRETATTAAVPATTPPAPMRAGTTGQGLGRTGWWEWKAHLNADDAQDSSWRKYAKDVAVRLEAAYRENGGSVPIVNVDDNYAVCFDDRDVGMVQYRRDDHTRWRPVRRRGGEDVPRLNKKRIRCVYPQNVSDSDSDTKAKKKDKKKKKKKDGMESDTDSDDYEDDGWLVDSDDDSDDDYDDSDDESWSASDSSSDAGVKRERAKKKKRAEGH